MGLLGKLGKRRKRFKTDRDGDVPDEGKRGEFGVVRKQGF